MPRWDRLLVFAALAVAFGAAAWAQREPNTLSEDEKAQGWKLLFDGKSLEGWKSTGKAEGWAVEEGCIACLSKGGGYLRTIEEYSDFEIKLEFRIAPRANSGIRLRSVNPNNSRTRGLEIQIMDSAGRKPTRNTCGSIYDCVAPTKDACKPAGEWNTMSIACRGSRITVEHNGEKIAEMDLDQWTTANQNPDGSKNKFPVAAKEMGRTGYLAIQDHGGRIWLRNVKLRTLR